MQAGGIPDRARIPDVAGRVEDAGADGHPGRRRRGPPRPRRRPRPRPAACCWRHRCRLLTFEDRAFAVLGDLGVVPLLGARDEEAAAAVLGGAMAACPPGTTISLGFLTAGSSGRCGPAWTRASSLSPDGPVFLSGDVGPFAPYVPSGWFL